MAGKKSSLTFENAGTKLKNNARAFVAVFLVPSVLIGGVLLIASLTGNGDSILAFYGILIALVGSFLGYIGGLLLAAIGTIAENTTTLATQAKPPVANKTENKQLDNKSNK